MPITVVSHRVLNEAMKRSAVLSPCKRYRYVLRRIWDDSREAVLFIALNPSTADAIADDPTVRRCTTFANDWGFGALWIANLFAFRTTDPATLRNPADPIGPHNDKWIAALHARAHLTIAAWGVHGALWERDRIVLKMLDGVHCLGRTRAGNPRHPLYLPRTAQPMPF